MAENDVQRFYRLHSRIYDQTRWLFLHGRRRAVAALELGPDKRILEVGCGTGLNFPLIAPRLAAGRGMLVGSDYSAAMLRRARLRVAAARWPHVHLVCQDACRAAFGHPFDAILFSYSLSMIADWRAALAQAHQNLRPGGRIVVLDFGTFDGWGPLRTPILTWLGLHHVEASRPWVAHLRHLFRSTQARSWGGGYACLAAAVR